MGLDVRRTPGIDAKTTKNVELIVMQYPHDAVNGGSRFFVDAQVNPLANDNLRPQVNPHLSTKTRTLGDGKKFTSYDAGYSGSQIAAIAQTAGADNTCTILDKNGQMVTKEVELADGTTVNAKAQAYAVKADIMLDREGKNFVINTKTLKESDHTLPKDFQAAMYATTQVNAHILKAIDKKIQTPETSKLGLYDKNRVQPTAADYREAVADFKQQYGDNIPAEFGDAKYAARALGRIEKYADLVEQGEKNLQAEKNAFSYATAEPAPQEQQEQQNVADKLAKVREQMESQETQKSADGPEFE